MLIKDLENKENILVIQPSKVDSKFANNHSILNTSISLSSLKENLAKFQFKLKNHKIDELRDEAQCFNGESKEISMTTSSDTLIDADSSFYSFKIDPIRQKNNLFKNFGTRNLKLNKEVQPFHSEQKQIDQNQLSLQEKFNQNNIKLKQHEITLKLDDENEIDDLNNVIEASQINPCIDNFEDDDDYDEENEKIIIAMEDLSISTLQTSNSITSDCIENSLFSFKSEDDDHFQENLKKLDEKIYNVKQMLSSMKSN